MAAKPKSDRGAKQAKVKRLCGCQGTGVSLAYNAIIACRGLNVNRGPKNIFVKVVLRMSTESQRMIAYQKECLEDIRIRTPKEWGLRDTIAKAAQRRGMSSRAYILEALRTQLALDGLTLSKVDSTDNDKTQP